MIELSAHLAPEGLSEKMSDGAHALRGEVQSVLAALGLGYEFLDAGQ
jgi:hypothetical protein